MNWEMASSPVWRTKMGDVIDIQTKKLIQDPQMDPAVAHRRVRELFDEMEKVEPASIGAFALIFGPDGKPSVGGFRGVSAAKVLYALNAYMASFIHENLGD